MFFNSATPTQKKEYENYLKLIGKLSNLFTDSKTPYLYYRIAEKIFCQAFDADDLSRSDVSADAKKDKLGIGLKTFLIGNSNSFQKVAEFNKDKKLYENLNPTKLIHKVAELRNQRINFTHNLHDLDNSIYHCVVRDTSQYKIYEEKMDVIDINNIKDIKENRSSISFNDGLHDYSFSLSKSTLNKRFSTASTIFDFQVDVLKNPLEDLANCLNSENLSFSTQSNIVQTIYLPLYGKNHIVYERSGLNQWNAGGRKRNYDEVYIPIPAIIHKKYNNFFPSRDTSFNLMLPNGVIMKSKVCQDGSKALMSYSNKELGNWILRDVLSLNEGELLTYSRLNILGIDSVRIDKLNDNSFEINFTSCGTYDEFINK